MTEMATRAGAVVREMKKPVYVISTDTMVENPVVALWVTESLAKISKAAQELGLPFEAKQLHPTVEDSFWVNLIGKGYPAPRHYGSRPDRKLERPSGTRERAPRGE